MNDYITERKEYIQQIRASFDEPREQYHTYIAKPIENTESEHNTDFKVRLFLSIFIFVLIFLSHYYSIPIFGIEVSEIIDRISDNQYYTFLENCDILKNSNYSELINSVFKSDEE